MARRGYSPLDSFEGLAFGALGRKRRFRFTRVPEERASSGRRLAAPRVLTSLAFQAGEAFTVREPISDVPCRRSGTAASAPNASLVAVLYTSDGKLAAAVSPRRLR
jgi:hypothetical protein